jgi:hypothetical protein
MSAAQDSNELTPSQIRNARHRRRMKTDPEYRERKLKYRRAANKRYRDRLRIEKPEQYQAIIRRRTKRRREKNPEQYKQYQHDYHNQYGKKRRSDPEYCKKAREWARKRHEDPAVRARHNLIARKHYHKKAGTDPSLLTHDFYLKDPHRKKP